MLGSLKCSPNRDLRGDCTWHFGRQSNPRMLRGSPSCSRPCNWSKSRKKAHGWHRRTSLTQPRLRNSPGMGGTATTHWHRPYFQMSQHRKVSKLLLLVPSNTTLWGKADKNLPRRHCSAPLCNSCNALALEPEKFQRGILRKKTPQCRSKSGPKGMPCTPRPRES